MKTGSTDSPIAQNFKQDNKRSSSIITPPARHPSVYHQGLEKNACIHLVWTVSYITRHIRAFNAFAYITTRSRTHNAPVTTLCGQRFTRPCYDGPFYDVMWTALNTDVLWRIVTMKDKIESCSKKTTRMHWQDWPKKFYKGKQKICLKKKNMAEAHSHSKKWNQCIRIIYFETIVA